MRRLITGVATGALALGLIASPALASQCPLLVKQINAAAGNRFDAAANTAKAMAAEADALHKAGKHADSVKKAEEAAKAMGLTLQMKK